MNRNFAGRWRASGPLLIAAIWIVVVFLFGGSSRSDSVRLILVYPLATFALMIGVWWMPAHRVRRHRWLFLLMAASFLLAIVHLVPLPPALWQTLPGREIVGAIDGAAGEAGRWRPLSMAPEAGLPALFALLVPAATLAIGTAIAARQQDRLALLVLALGGLSAILGLIQILSGSSSGWYLHEITSRGLPVGLFANRNHQAAMLACLIPMLAWATTRIGGSAAKRRVGGALAAGAGLALIPLILVCGSRAGVALAALGIGGAVWIILDGRDRATAERGERRGRRLVIAALGVGIAAITAAALLMNRDLAFARLGAQELDGEFRLTAWQAIWAMAREYFPVGSGLGTFREVYRIDEPYMLLSRTYLNHAHNDFLELLMTGGLPALAILLVALFAYGVGLVCLIRSVHRHDLQLARLGAIIIAILAAASFTDYPLRVPSLACLLVLAAMWMMAGLRGAAAESLESRAHRG